MSDQNLEKCWHCQSDIQKVRFFCPVCERIQEPRATMTPFDLFEIPLSFTPDLARLEAQHLRLSQLLHPDRFHAGNTREKLFASLHTANLNDAYKKLKNIVSRGHLLLNCLGVDARNQEDKRTQDPSLLQEAFADQEALAEAHRPEAIREIVRSLQSRQMDCYEALKRAFDTQDFDNAAQELDRYRYYEKALKDASQKERRFLDLETDPKNTNTKNNDGTSNARSA